MRNAVQPNVTHIGANDHLLSKQQKNALHYWNAATSQLEKTSRSVLDLFRRNKDNKNYSKYESQYDDFKKRRKLLSSDVRKAIQSNNLQHIEEVIGNAVKKLKEMVYLHGKPEKCHLQRSMSDEYDEALLALTKCMAALRKRLQIIDKCLSRLSEEMTLYSAMGKELQSLMKSTVRAKKDKRENVASSVIALAPEIMSYIQTE